MLTLKPVPPGNRPVSCRALVIHPGQVGWAIVHSLRPLIDGPGGRLEGLAGFGFLAEVMMRNGEHRIAKGPIGCLRVDRKRLIQGMSSLFVVPGSDLRETEDVL